jgi:hypothetical protein
MLLSPAAERIAGKRILIVAEGALQYVPFAVLPEPGGEGPLMIGHEIVTTPSASVLAVLRQETANRQPAERTLFVAADPVYSADDPRVSRPPIQPAAEGVVDQFPRLRFSRAEAEQIARLVPSGSAATAFDFEANRASLLRADLARFRILHFATHGVLDNTSPLYSELVLAAPHSGLRNGGDQTDRLIAAIRNPHVNILAHPRGRISGTRSGLSANWEAVFSEAARHGVAIEIDGDPARQDLDYSLAARAFAAGCVFALDSDAHTTSQLRYVETALAHARLASIPSDRIVNCWPTEQLLAWLSDQIVHLSNYCFYCLNPMVGLIFAY